MLVLLESFFVGFACILCLCAHQHYWCWKICEFEVNQDVINNLKGLGLSESDQTASETVLLSKYRPLGSRALRTESHFDDQWTGNILMMQNLIHKKDIRNGMHRRSAHRLTDFFFMVLARTQFLLCPSP